MCVGDVNVIGLDAPHLRYKCSIYLTSSISSFNPSFDGYSLLLTNLQVFLLV